MEIKDILRRPYQRLLIPDAESGTFTAMIGEFPGCVAEGDTAAEAYELLESTAESWLEGAMEAGLPIPKPGLDHEYSGRVVLRMPRSTHRRAAEAALRDGVSLNAYLLVAVSERLGEERAKRKVTV